MKTKWSVSPYILAVLVGLLIALGYVYAHGAEVIHYAH